jgi:hypothetical protein
MNNTHRSNSPRLKAGFLIEDLEPFFTKHVAGPFNPHPEDQPFLPVRVGELLSSAGIERNTRLGSF